MMTDKMKGAVLLKLRSDKRKNPEYLCYRVIEFDEIKAWSKLDTWKRPNHIDVVDQFGNVATVKITSIKSWKRRPNDLEINCKFGLYEYFTITIRDGETDMTIVERVYS